MLTRPWVIPKMENCRNANFASLWSLQVVIIMTTWVMTMLSPWRLSVFSAMSYQILDQYSLIPLYYLWWSDIFHHSEPFVKMWYESLFHTCHRTGILSSSQRSNRNTNHVFRWYKYRVKDLNRKWQDYVYIQCEYKSTKQKIKHLLREENKVKENKIS